MRQLSMRPVMPALVLATLMAAGQPAFAAPRQDVPVIAVTGHGEVTAAPDTASVTAGVTTEGATARAALDANTKAMTGLVATLKAAGIDDKDIQTTSFSVSPRYDNPPRNDNGDTPPPHIAGYEVRNGVSVTVHKLGGLGALLDAIVSSGGNTVDGVNFSVSDPSKLMDTARKAAFADARDKAETYAGAAGLALGKVVSISEGGGSAPPRPMFMKAMAAPMAAEPVPVQAGQLTFDVDVDVRWALSPSN